MDEHTPDTRQPTAASLGLPARAAQWRRRFTALTMAWLAFETLTGLSIYLLPFSVTNQWMVMIHTGLGLLFLVPVLIYQVAHLGYYWSRPASANLVLGYLSSAATLAAVVSGIVLTVQAVAGPRISYAWDMAHVISTFALILFALPHVVLVLARDRGIAFMNEARDLFAAQRRALLVTALLTVGFFVIVGIVYAIYPGDELHEEFPADYSFKYGPDRPFAPSLAKTETGGAYDPRSLAGSESCGTSGCHEQIVAEWSVSAHRWSAMDLAFQGVQTEMAKQNGPESTRYCGGCHDPISLFSGTKNIFAENLTGLHGYKEGVSCLVCHSVRTTDLEGNANYVIARPTRYLFELGEGDAPRLARDFLLRAYPRQHVQDLSKRLFKTPEYCAACHKQFIDEEVNNVGWVQLQNQYDNWRKSRWNHPDEPNKTIECRECHMPLQASTDPASGDELDYNRTADDGKHRSHRFLAANQLMPALLKLPGGEEQIELTEKWLRGDFEIPEIASKWAGGPAVGIEVIAPEQAGAGDEVPIRAVVTSNKVGHDFPTGPLDIIQAWVELTVTDPEGNLVYNSGTVDENHFIKPGSFLFKAEPVDQYGNLIDRHNLWEMVGVRYRRALFPGFSDTAQYAFRCPGDAGTIEQPTSFKQAFNMKAPAADSGTLKVTARLLYRKADQYLLNFLFAGVEGLTAPITEMARAEAEIQIEPGKTARAEPAKRESTGRGATGARR